MLEQHQKNPKRTIIMMAWNFACFRLMDYMNFDRRIGKVTGHNNLVHNSENEFLIWLYIWSFISDVFYLNQSIWKLTFLTFLRIFFMLFPAQSSQQQQMHLSSYCACNSTHWSQRCSRRSRKKSTLSRQPRRRSTTQLTRENRTEQTCAMCFWRQWRKANWKI